MEGERVGEPEGLSKRAGELGVGEKLANRLLIGAVHHFGSTQTALALAGFVGEKVALVSLLVLEMPLRRWLETLLGGGVCLELGHLSKISFDTNLPPSLPNREPKFPRLEEIRVGTRGLEPRTPTVSR